LEEVEERKNQNDFSQGSPLSHIMKMALPMMLAQAASILYNLVDRMYIGRIPEIGREALTGVGVAFPVIMIFTAVANMFGTGGGPRCSIDRGKGDLDHAEKVMGNAFFLIVVFGIGLSVICYAFKRPLLYLVGASDATIGFADQYMSIYLIGTLFSMISLGMNNYINAQGFAKIGMMTVIIGAVLNIILDPIFIFLLDMGVRGAALATVISQFISAAWALKFLFSKKAILKFTLDRMRPDGEIIKSIFALGFAGFIGVATNAAVNLVANGLLKNLGGDLYVGAMTVITSLREGLTLVVMGMVNGAGPVIGFNYGARLYKRTRECMKIAIILSLSFNIAIWAVTMLFPEALIRIFNSDPQLIAVGVPAVKRYYCLFFMLALMAAGQTCFLSLGKAKQAAFFSLFRKVMLGIPLMFLLPYVFGLGANGVYTAEPITDTIAGIASMSTLFLTVWRKLKNTPDGEPID